GYLAFLAGKVLVESSALALTIGVIGPSVAQSLIGRHITPASSASILLLIASIPLILDWLATALLLAREARSQIIDWGAGNRIFIFLGAVTFAALAAFGLLTFRSGDYIQTIRHLAP